MSTRKAPNLRQYKRTNRAVVTLVDTETRQRRDFYLGEFGSPEAAEAYASLIRDWRSRGERLDLAPTEPSQLIEAAQAPITLDSVARLVLDYAKHIEAKGGVKPGQIGKIKRAIRFARIASHPMPGDVAVQCGALSISEFGPSALQSVRAAMIAARKKNGQPWVRKTINEHMLYVVNMFEWAVGEQRAAMHLPVQPAGILCCFTG